jgi:hypothetical protein
MVRGGLETLSAHVDGVLPNCSAKDRKSRRNVSRYPAVVWGLASRFAQ